MPPPILAVMNQKGGIGKTTVARLASEYFAKRGRRVLGLDADPQCNYSSRFLPMERGVNLSLAPPTHPNFDPANKAWANFPAAPPGYWSLAQLYSLGYAEPYPTQIKNLSIIPGHTHDMAGFLADVKQANMETTVIDHLQAVLNDDFYTANFDLIIIDTGPQASTINKSVLHAATHLLIPTQLHPSSIEAMMQMAAAWKTECGYRTADNPLVIAGILPTHYNPRATQQQHHLQTLAQTKGTRRLIMPPMRSMTTYQTASTTYESKSLFELHAAHPCRQNATPVFESLRKTLGL